MRCERNYTKSGCKGEAEGLLEGKISICRGCLEKGEHSFFKPFKK